MLKRLISCFILGALGLLLLPLPTSAAALTIIPPKFEFTADPGETFSDVIKINNSGDESVTLYSSVQDFISSGETGQPSFVENAEDSISLRGWINVNEGEPVTVAPNQKTEIPFTVNVPEDAEPGGHYGAVFFSPPASEGQVGVQQRIGSLVLIRVSGEIRESGELTHFGTYSKPADKLTEALPLNNPLSALKEPEEPESKATPQSLFENTPIPFVIRFENSGNVHLKPRGKIELYNFGQKVEDCGVRTILNANGVPINKEIVDYLPVNDVRGNVLARSSRRFDTLFSGKAYWYYHQDGTKEVRYEKPLFGYYTAKLHLTYGSDNEEVVREVTFIILPWKQALVGLLALIVIVCGFIFYRRWSKKRLRAQIMAEMEQKTKSTRTKK